jgi:parallel beta-helix repeat protein
VLKRIVSGTMLAFLLIGMLTLAFNIQPVKASGTIYIKAEGSIDPPTAPISSIDNVTYTFTDNINDSIVVERDNIVVGGAGYSVQGTGSGTGIELSGRRNVTISNMKIREFEYGISLGLGSSNNTVSGNNVTNNQRGIWLVCSSNNFLRDNVMAGNTYNFGVSGGELLDFVNDIDPSNIVDGKPVYYWVNRRGAVVPLDAGYVALVNCTNIKVENLTLTKNLEGILLAYTSNSTITGNNVAKNLDGIWLDYYSSNNTISRNNVAKNCGGVRLLRSSNNTVSGNSITANNCVGIWLDDSSNNSIVGNSITANNYDGIRLDDSSNNFIYHNNFLSNTNQASSDEYSGNNVWDDGYPSGGNQWSNYTGVDLYSGPCQNVTGSDRIGDTPYIIDANNRDRYPLMVPKHELVVSLTTPTFLKLGSSSSLAAIVTNKGSSEEKNVELRLLINGTIANSTTISLLQAGNSYTLTYLWTPTVEGTYNVTAYAPPVFGEALTENNQQTIFVNVSAPELIVSITAPASLRLGTSSPLSATVGNQGLSNETDVELWLFINGTIVNSTIIPILQAGDLYMISYLWTPTVEGTYNVTAYARPVPGETSIQNNQMTKFVTVSVPPEIGVKADDWIKCTYTISGWPSGTPYPEWLKVEFLSVEGTNATIRVTMRMSDGTEPSQTMTIDVAAGGGTFQGLSGFVIPANCTTGDSIYMTGYGIVTIAGETTRIYAGASRTVVYASFSQYGTQLTYYWDKQTGVMVEASAVSGSVTGTAKATETNMWQAAPSGLPIEPVYLYILAALAIIVVGGAAVFIVRRRKKTPEKVES